VFHITIWGDLELCLGGLSPPKLSNGDGTESAAVFPKVSTEISDEAMPIQDPSLFTGKFNRVQISRLTKFSD